MQSKPRPASYDTRSIHIRLRQSNLTPIILFEIQWITFFSKDLESKLRSELGGHFEKVMLALCLPRAEYMAHEINRAIGGLGTKEGSLIEILCSGTNYEIREMVAAYERCKIYININQICPTKNVFHVVCSVRSPYGRRYWRRYVWWFQKAAGFTSSSNTN